MDRNITGQTQRYLRSNMQKYAEMHTNSYEVLIEQIQAPALLTLKIWGFPAQRLCFGQ